MKSLKVYGWDVPVIRQKGLSANSPFAGYYDPVNKHVVIDASFKGDDFFSTLVHELIHVLFHRAGLHQTKIPIEVEEVIAEQVATAIIENFTLSAKRKR